MRAPLLRFESAPVRRSAGLKFTPILLETERKGYYFRHDPHSPISPLRTIFMITTAGHVTSSRSPMKHDHSTNHSSTSSIRGTKGNPAWRKSTAIQGTE